ncbi:hypothetical protein UFOVP1349_45 [uncultured Caudovirales phage]|uniref:Uncharacterized protein n=1 Tax=uncultured Caudovirales phage TaxID=2100421 RepID=A0A6J5S1U7_9CAUD|nr:hypothetical protein UFOVP925_55 [uncultured Caudovirales phage]CAB4184342.1 hypothetical protein UFOVP1097_51 [uncultured Caudovirales phage]CAB4200422.1 hypothetical protein UFOVP1349_45 [uncultured Caudovirales phage]CAB4214251.1 hypothetical protein UFOVP1456_25 [uncultured Caudovirales phage]
MALRFAPTRGAGAITLNALIRGPQGAAATIAVGSTTTGAAASSADVSNSGSTVAATFNFTIPRGADSGMRYAFESSTTMAAPASGGARLNNATLASVTAIAVNATNSDGVDISDFIATWDDSTNTTKGTLVVRKEGSGAVLGVFTLGTVTDNTTWLQIAVTYVSGSGSLSATNPVYLTANLTGNKGTDGNVSGPGVSVDSEIALWNGTSGTTLKRASTTGILKGTAGVISAATLGTDYGDFSSNTATSVDGEMLLFSGTAGKTGKRSTLTGGLLKSTSGVPAIATADMDYTAPTTFNAQVSRQFFIASMFIG